MRQYVYCTAIRHGGVKEWDFLWKKYLDTEISGEKETILTALACSRDVWVLTRFARLALSPEVRVQNVDRVLNHMSKNPIGQPIVFGFLKNNFTDLQKT